MRYELLILVISAVAFGGPVESWDRFEKNVRDQTLPKDSLKTQFPAVYQSVQRYADGFQFSEKSPWVFPLEGCTIRDIGKGGFLPDIYYGGSPIKGYDFFDGNKHGGHPAYDIFIRDKNRDCRDDRTGRPVEVIAPEDLLVLSVNSTWTDTSSIRGGNYVWGYIPGKELVVYFAHLDSVAVSGGAVVRAGQPLGTIGRSGRGANLPRSPTHLHMMVLRYRNGMLKPVDFIGYLLCG